MTRTPSILVALVLLAGGVTLFLFARETDDLPVASADPGLSRASRADERGAETRRDGRPLSVAAPLTPAGVGREEARPVELEKSEEPGAFLRVVDDVDGEPVSGLRMRIVLFGAEEVDEAGTANSTVLGHQFPVTEEDGLVNLLPILEGIGEARIQSISLLLLERCELTLEPGSFRASLLGATPEEALLVRADRRLVAPIRGVVVDADSSLPLPGVALRIQRWIDLQDADATRESVFIGGGYVRSTQIFDGATAEWVVADESGRFSTEVVLPSGRVGFLTVDHERTDAQHVVVGDGEARECTFEVPAGPLILLDFDPPGGRQHTEFVAGIWRAPEELVRNGGIEEYPSPWSRDGGTRAGHWGNASAVHGFAPPWFRPSIESIEDSPLPTRVFVASRDGRLLGHALVHELERYATQPLRIELTERASLDGVLVWPEEQPAIDGAHLTLTSRGARGDDGAAYEATRWVLRWHGEDEAPFLFQFAPEGDFDLLVEADGAEEQTLEVRIPQSIPLRVQLVPQRSMDLHEVSGRVVTVSGKPMDGLEGRAKLSSLLVRGLDGAPNLPRVELDWQDDGARFVLKDVPGGKYGVSAHWQRGGYSISGIREGLRVPVMENGGRFELVVADDVESQVLEIRVLDPRDEGRVSLVVRDGGTLVARTHLEFCKDGDPDEGVTVLDGRRVAMSRFGPYPVDARVEMFIQMEGYRSPILGGETFGPMDAEGVRVAEIRPTKGWSARIHVYEADQGKRLRPLEGIVLSFDGHATQSTDQAGFVYAETDQVPSRINVLTPGWELVDRSSWAEWGSVIAAERAFTVEDGRLTVHLRAH